jgi:beta-galactosidase/beta-glucuronidase
MYVMKRLWLAMLTTLSLTFGGLAPSVGAAGAGPSHVTVEKQADGSYQYLVNGHAQVFIGMGYDPIYRYLSNDQRVANYRRDFTMLKAAGVNTITGWDADKGYEQDKFDELTLNTANQYGIGVVMPLNLPPELDYSNPDVVSELLAEGRAKVERYKDNPAVRMWGVGNEVYWEMDPDMYPAFSDAYLKIADMFHQLDPNHPVIYREAEDRYMPVIVDSLKTSGDMRPWLQFGVNIYDKDPRPLLSNWPDWDVDRPLFVSEFGWQGETPQERAGNYLDMWHAIREFPKWVMGGAPYVWTTAGPEPTDKIWGLMDKDSHPVDGAFSALSQAWRIEPTANH